MLFAHEITYPQLAAAKVAVVTTAGEMIGGPDRRNETDAWKWREWQQAIQIASRDPKSVPPEVMAYFQDTKHLLRPPQLGDVALGSKKPLQPNIKQTGETLVKPFTPPRFTWSFSALDQFINVCACQAAAQRYYKTIPYIETESQKAGNRVHKAGELYLLNPTTENAVTLDREEPKARRIDDLILNATAKSGGTLLVEKKLCINDKWIPTGYFDADAWGRGAADIALLRGEVANIYDRKTGKRKDNPLQLRIMILFLALYYPHIQEFNAANIWYRDDNPIQAIPTVRRSEVRTILIEVKRMIDHVQAMWESENFPARRGGLCKNWCSNRDCPHCGC